jgi:hypothetical protein
VTTTTAPATTTTTIPPSTTTSSTVAPPAKSSSSSSWWIWLIVALAVVGAAAGAYFLVRRRRAHAAAAAAWRRDLGVTAENATSVKEMLDDASAEPIAGDSLRALQNQVDTTATQFAGLAARAPDDEARARTSRAEQALRGYMAAVEDEQLPDAAATRAASAQELDGALAALDELMPPPS